MVVRRTPSYGRNYTSMPCTLKSVYVMYCVAHLWAKNIAITYGVTHVQEEVMYFGTYISFVSSIQVVSKSFDSIVVSVLLRLFMLVYSCYVSLVSLAGWKLGTGWTDGFRFPRGIEICFDKSHVPTGIQPTT